jgi:hypothetical protein
VYEEDVSFVVGLSDVVKLYIHVLRAVVGVPVLGEMNARGVVHEDVCRGCLRSLRSLRSLRRRWRLTIVAVSAAAMYSASVDDSAITVCRCERHCTAPLLRRST